MLPYGKVDSKELEWEYVTFPRRYRARVYNASETRSFLSCRISYTLGKEAMGTYFSFPCKNNPLHLCQNDVCLSLLVFEALRKPQFVAPVSGGNSRSRSFAIFRAPR